MTGVFACFNRALTLSVYIFIITTIVFIVADASRAAEDGQLRKKLFLMERQLARVSDARPKAAGRLVDVNGPLSPEEMKKKVEEALKAGAEDMNVKGASGTVAAGGKDGKQAAKGGNEADAATADDKQPTDFGNVTAKIEGGSLTSYSYSGTGIDLTSLTPDYGVVLLLQSNDIDISSMQQDSSMKDKFASANQESFYGLKDYKDMAQLFEKKKDAPAKDYTMTGLGMNMKMGGYSLGIVNYSRPPQRKEKVFFGNDSVGPYQIGSTGIVPGTESVRAGGAELTRGAGYEINYNRGEITFGYPIPMSDKIIVEGLRHKRWYGLT